MTKNNCYNCGEILRGRADKKFCDDHCRSHFNNKKHRNRNSTIRRVNSILRKNRNILSSLLPTEKPVSTCIGINKIRNLGFAFGYYTHIRKTGNGEICYHCYDVGYIRQENQLIILKNTDSGLL